MPSANSPHNHNWRPLCAGRLALAWLLATSLWLGQVAQAAPLLRPAAPTLGAEERAQLEGDPHVMRWREAWMAVDGVFEPSAGNGPLALNLFPDAALEARVRSARTLESGSRFLSGALAGGGRFTLFRSAGGILRGEFHSAAGVFTMRSLGGQRVLVKQLDLSGLTRCGHDAPIGEVGPNLTSKASATARRLSLARDGRNVPAPTTAATPTIDVLDQTVDVLVVYTPNAKRSEGGREEIEASIEAEIEKTNQAFVNSGLSHRRVKLARMEEVDYMQSTEHIAHDLQYLHSKIGSHDPGGLLDEVHDLRKIYAADIIHLVVEQAKVNCGRALVYGLHDENYGQDLCAGKSNVDSCIQRWRKDVWRRRAFSVSAIACTVQDTFTHELGHNLGLIHNRYSYGNLLSLNDDTGFFPNTPYGFGYVNQNFSRSECSYTIMADGQQCIDEGYRWAVEELMFSNPDLQLGSEEVGYDPAGVAGEEWTTDLDGPVNASRAIDDVWGIVANLYYSITAGSDALVSGETELLGAEKAGLDLADYFDAGADGGALTYAATVDDPDLASVSLVGSILTVTANEDGEDGVVTVTATATDEAGETATLRFEVTISPRPPSSWRGWRSTLAPPADDA